MSLLARLIPGNSTKEEKKKKKDEKKEKIFLNNEHTKYEVIICLLKEELILAENVNTKLISKYGSSFRMIFLTN